MDLLGHLPSEQKEKSPAPVVEEGASRAPTVREWNYGA